MSHRNSYEGIDEEIVDAVKAVAGRAVGRSGLTASDKANLEQDLMLRVLRVIPKYDPARGGKRAFARAVAIRSLHEIYRWRSAYKRDWRKSISLNQMIGDDEESGELIDMLDTEGNLASHTPGALQPAMIFNFKMDINDIVSRMPLKLRELCEELKFMMPMEIAKKRGVSKSTISRKIEQVRKFMQGHCP